MKTRSISKFDQEYLQGICHEYTDDVLELIESYIEVARQANGTKNPSMNYFYSSIKLLENYVRTAVEGRDQLLKVCKAYKTKYFDKVDCNDRLTEEAKAIIKVIQQVEQNQY